MSGFFNVPAWIMLCFCLFFFFLFLFLHLTPVCRVSRFPQEKPTTAVLIFHFSCLSLSGVYFILMYPKPPVCKPGLVHSRKYKQGITQPISHTVFSTSIFFFFFLKKKGLLLLLCTFLLATSLVLERKNYIHEAGSCRPTRLLRTGNPALK